ncbi:HNH endonuclease signature motif containing protein [Limimaricola sp. AA108-03]|uniref:HNH endonuclease signature motif containing protein n=1 Tax=Limimaricola sp. AA108-03 TaxID=3425945 RepID=UPI003D781701
MRRQPISYSEYEEVWIKVRSHLPRHELHQLFCETFRREDVSQANLTALCKRRGWLTGRTGRFEKGTKPVNKGKTMPFNPNSAATRFKKGQRPHTWRGAGHEAIDPKEGYVWMIVAETNPYTGAPTRRVLKHKWLWEKAHGPIPEGHALKCLDGDKTNCAPSNWEAVPRALLPRLNGRFGRGYDQAPEELKLTILAVAKLEHAARQARRKRRGTKKETAA